MHSQLYDYLASNNLLAVNQFRRGRSTSLALTQFTDEVLENMDKGLVNGVVFIDLKKAFDTLDHGIMLKTLNTTGVCCVNLDWFDFYLSSRCQKTVLGQVSDHKLTLNVSESKLMFIGGPKKVTTFNAVTLFDNNGKATG